MKNLDIPSSTDIDEKHDIVELNQKKNINETSPIIKRIVDFIRNRKKATFLAVLIYTLLVFLFFYGSYFMVSFFLFGILISAGGFVAGIFLPKGESKYSLSKIGWYAFLGGLLLIVL